MDPDRETVKVALIQCISGLGTVADNIAHIEVLCRKAASNGAKILVLPETAITGYLELTQNTKINWRIPGRPIDPQFQSKELTSKYAEPQNGPSVQHFAKLAQELEVYITVPFIEIDSDSKFYNAVSLVGPKKQEQKEGGPFQSLAHYRKNCPWPLPEQSWATPGESIEGAFYKTEYGTVGLAICFDIHTILAKYANKSLWALLYPIAWVGNTEGWFSLSLPSRLRKVNCPFYILGANWASNVRINTPGHGGSTIYGPGGSIEATSMTLFSEDIVFAEIPVQKDMEQIGELDLETYRHWTESQIGTDFWNQHHDWFPKSK